MHIDDGRRERLTAIESALAEPVDCSMYRYEHPDEPVGLDGER